MRPKTFYQRVLIESGRHDADEAKRATEAVLQALRDRLTSEEANQAAAQLPAELKALWRAHERPGRRPTRMHRDEFYERVRAQVGLASTGEAREVVRAVFAALKDQISAGEADDVLAQLPRDLKTVWEAA